MVQSQRKLPSRVSVDSGPGKSDMGLDCEVPRSSNHPTKVALVATAANLLRQYKVNEITVDMVLNESKISKGSLYHHFEDLDELIETALLDRYARWIEVSVVSMTQVLTQSKNSTELFAGLVEITRLTQAPDGKGERIYRAEVLTMAASSPRLANKLSVLQQQLTDALTHLIREAQERGFYKKNLDPKAIAVFIQAYTLGKIIDDFSADQVDPESYVDMVNTIIKTVFME